MSVLRSFATTALAIAVFVPNLSGCGGGDGPTGTVSGKITFQGKAIPKGSTVVFTPEKGGAGAFGNVAEDGTYSLTFKDSSNIPAGKYTVSITPPANEMSTEDAMKMSMGKAPPKKPAKIDTPEIPEKYRNAETSGESFEIVSGENTYNLDMKPK